MVVMYLFNLYQHSLLVTPPPHRRGDLNISVTEAFPRSSVLSPRSRVTVVLLVTLVLHFWCASQNLPSVRLRQPGRQGDFPWYSPTNLSLQYKSPNSGVTAIRALVIFRIPRLYNIINTTILL